MPWFIDAAEKHVTEADKDRLITIGPFSTEKRAIKVRTALCGVLQHVSEPYEREAKAKVVMEGLYERIPEPDEEPAP